MYNFKVILLVVSVIGLVIGREDLEISENYNQTVDNFFKNFYPLLRSPNVRMRDGNEVFQKITKINDGKAEKLRVISDFDQTLTVQHIKGKSTLSTYEVLFQNDLRLAEMFGKEMRILKNYMTKESRTRSMEENAEFINGFTERQKSKLIGLPYNPEKIAELAVRYGPPLRKRAQEFLKSLNTVGIPILVFSAGVGNVVEAMLESQNAMTSNTRVIANYLEFEDDKISGFEESIVHPFNKHKRMDKKGGVLFPDWRDRTNVLVMGDNLGDAVMADGFENAENVLKIGFIPQAIDDRLTDFEKSFDVVIIDDQTMNIPIQLVSELTKTPETPEPKTSETPETKTPEEPKTTESEKEK